MKICVIGVGYVGLVSAACFAEMGNNVYCIDKNEKIINNLRRGKIHIYEPNLQELVTRNIEKGRLHFSTNLNDGLEKSLFVFNCVGTPSKADGTCNLSYVYEVAKEIGQNIESYKVIINKSTVPVGTAQNVSDIIYKELSKRNKQSIYYNVVSNPEFLKEGDAVNDFMKPDRIIIGTNSEKPKKLLTELYSSFAHKNDKIIIMDVKSAEMTKYASNCMLATKISFINEMANICDKVGANIRDVRNGMGADKRIGYHFLYPSIGYGGSCFPKDIRALINLSCENKFYPELLKAVDSVNNHQKHTLGIKISDYFEDLNDITLAVWGLSFKANTDDIRESSALVVINDLLQEGANINAFDPEANDNVRKLNRNINIFDDQYETLKDADALVVLTEWNQFRNPDFKQIKELLNKPIIFDGRNLYSTDTMKSFGFHYESIGTPRITNEII